MSSWLVFVYQHRKSKKLTKHAVLLERGGKKTLTNGTGLKNNSSVIKLVIKLIFPVRLCIVRLLTNSVDPDQTAP